MANAAKVTLSLTIPPRQTYSFRRGTANARPASVSRKPSYISPSTYYISLNAVSGGASIYSTYFTIAQCSNQYGVYQCTTNLPYGTFTLYTNLYDQQGYMLSTNMYSNPYPVTVYPNGSPYDNNLYVQTAGVLANLQIETPSGCFAAGAQQSIPLLFLDADGNTIVGPLANPFTGNVTAYNGAGLSAISAYVMYAGSPLAANTLTISDTSLYASPYFFVSGQEGAVNVAASVANIPIYANGAGSPASFTASAGIAATGTYVAFGVENGPMYGVYAIAIQQTLNQAVLCGNGSVNGLSNSFTYIGSILSPTAPYLVISDYSNDVGIFDASFTANYTLSYSFFQQGNSYGLPGPRFNPNQTAQFTAPAPFVDFFTSANVTGRINVLYQGITTGVIETIDTSNGAITSNNPFDATAGIVFSGSTRITGSPTTNTLYYDVPGTPWLYGINASSSPGTADPTIDFSSTPPADITGQIYALSPSGAGTPATEVVRGADLSGNYWVCAFDSNNFAGGIYCHATSSHNSNVGSIQYDPLTGDLMWASGGTSVFAIPVHGVTPSTFISTNFPAATSVYTLSHNASRILPGLEGVPGVVGLYDGPQASGPCTGSGEITWLRYNAGSWLYLAHTCWPNHYVTLTYP